MSNIIKRLIFILILLLCMALVQAGLNKDISDCGDNIRCVYRVAAEYSSLESCNTLKEELVSHCKRFVIRQNPELELPSSAVEEKEGSGIVYLISGAVLILVLFFVFFFLLKRHKQSFLRDNAKLINYVKSSLNSGSTDNQIRDKLKSLGWKEHIIDNALREVKK